MALMTRARLIVMVMQKYNNTIKYNEDKEDNEWSQAKNKRCGGRRVTLPTDLHFFPLPPHRRFHVGINTRISSRQNHAISPTYNTYLTIHYLHSPQDHKPKSQATSEPPKKMQKSL
jgi:hypothetical protein